MSWVQIPPAPPISGISRLEDGQISGLRKLTLPLTKHNLLVTTDLIDQLSFKRLSKHATVFSSTHLGENEIVKLLPSIDSLMIFSWPSFLTRERTRTMTQLQFVQSILAGVNHIPFSYFSKGVVVCSNAGAYSDGVAEHAWALVLAVAKRIVEQNIQIRAGTAALVRHGDAAARIRVLEGKTLGILGYGGIGTSVAKLAMGFGMKVSAFSRHVSKDSNVQARQGTKGFNKTLETSDIVVLALPLTKFTTGIIDKNALSRMKKNAILVNIARGELVDESSLFDHLNANGDFQYATDVWWYKNGRESLMTDFPFATLPNFTGTLHVSGPSVLATGPPVLLAVQNTLRFLRNQTPKNIVDRSEYIPK
jgi:D-3-phosphoglycerate dehydrogenase / 2-oxoglutarate reductase